MTECFGKFQSARGQPMNVFTAPAAGEMGKFQGVTRAFPQAWDGSLLDVGCRSGNLKRCLNRPGVRYCGLDLYPPADVIGNLENGLPFKDEAFDTVVALDVLEHTDDIHRCIQELCRVARQYVVISLPNAYEMKGRLRFFLGRPLSGKYGLPAEPPRDRHRWLFSFAEAREFCAHSAKCQGYQVVDEGCLIGPRRGFPLVRLLVPIFPNLFSPTYLALLGKTARG
jgi:SAM-dependent methyltransferase